MLFYSGLKLVYAALAFASATSGVDSGSCPIGRADRIVKGENLVSTKYGMLSRARKEVSASLDAILD